MANISDFLDFLAGRKALRKAAGDEGDVSSGTAAATPKRPEMPENRIDIGALAEQQAQRAGRGEAMQKKKKKSDSEGYSAYQR